MKPLVFTLLEKPEQSLDLSALTPDRLAGLRNRAQINSVKLRLGKRRIKLGDIFSVSGQDRENIELRRTTDKATGIGRDMSRGRITVRGHGGDYLGQGMQGGNIRLTGDCGDWLGCDMHWGNIEVSGNAGNFIGNGSHGSMLGMHDGLITVWGDAGNRIGDKMRRGMIMIAGRAGDYAGARMVAGTILVLGKSGKLPGYGMKRGSIILGRKPALIGATQASCGILKMEYLRLFFKQLSRMGSRYRLFREFGPEAHRYAGDMANNGKGEIMILLNANR